MSVAFVRATPQGRRVVVTLRGERRARRAALARLLPELEVASEETSSPVQERVHGHLPESAAGAPAGRALWPPLAAFERRWLGDAGALLLVSVAQGHLSVKGIVEAGDPELLRLNAPAAGRDTGLFAREGLGATVRPLHPALGDAEPAWQLKPREIEAARAAVALGYYENPRRCTMEDIARVLGITKSAVYHRMHGLEHKAVRRILTMHAPMVEQPALVALPAHHVEQGLIHPPAAGGPAWAHGRP